MNALFLSRSNCFGDGLFFGWLCVAACGDSVVPTTMPQVDRLDPQFTVGSGVTPTIIARGNLGRFHVHSRADDYGLELKSHDDTDIQVRSAIASPGSYSGWHTHRGPVILVIKTGALTVYDSTDPTCAPRTYGPGTAFFEGTAPHNVRKEGAIAVEYATVYFTSAGGPTRIEADFPVNCPR